MKLSVQLGTVIDVGYILFWAVPIGASRQRIHMTVES